MAMPWGRSVVTLQGPSLRRRSASARRWRTLSSVQASLRTMAECRASASESETRVMGMPTAWAHDTSVTTSTALFTNTDCSGYHLGRWEDGLDRGVELSLRRARWQSAGLRLRSRKRGSWECPRHGHTTPALRRARRFSLTQIVADTTWEGGRMGWTEGSNLSGGALVGGVELAADQGDQGDQVHPDQQRDAGADGAVHHVIAGEMAHIPGESQGGEEPQDGGQGGAAPDEMPALFAVGAVVVERGSHGDGGDEGEDVAGDPAGALPEPGEWREEGVDLHPVE